MSGNFEAESIGLKTAQVELGALPNPMPYSNVNSGRSVPGSTCQMSCSVSQSNSWPPQLVRQSEKGPAIRKSDPRFIGVTFRLKGPTIRSVLDQCCHQWQPGPL